MPYKQDIEYDLKEKINEDCKYIISSLHRKYGNPNKSIWCITPDDEIDCFIFSYLSEWFDDKHCWGIYLENTDLQVLGYNSNSGNLKIDHQLTR